IRAERVCLVLSRSGKRWVLPKGCIERGQSAGETALQEAWEEAGLVGTLHPEPVGSYLYDKAGTTCHVIVFLMQVTEVAQNWPEASWRRRRWLGPEKTLACVREPSLGELLSRLLIANPVALSLTDLAAIDPRAR